MTPTVTELTRAVLDRSNGLVTTSAEVIVVVLLLVLLLEQELVRALLGTSEPRRMRAFTALVAPLALAFGVMVATRVLEVR